MLQLSRKRFEDIVADALEEISARFHTALDNVAVVVEDEPTAAQHGDAEGELFGLYEGVPLTEQSVLDPGLPARVFIFRGPILRGCRTLAQVRREIRDTVVHELGHHMGLDDHEMPY